ncbi:TetR/AcrR family transcriptional regulator [Nonlabens mediterrranea]|uniref:TetR/AcrR family transcriptional regulator n=1 Tax=Nonlabens mediterrranea TaxID=1419947 RepID=A0ABS0A7R1_9FLAO|nr:TetR/AcrR family transcriptional regulator [Nonlabens mediterrranea]
MRNPQLTRDIIINESADLFNTKGYKATSLSDITTATGFTKGAIYKHFKNKEDLEQQALRSLSKRMFDILNADLKNATDFSSKMNVIFNFFENYLDNPPYSGGCPLMNSACESDDLDAGLRQQSFGMLVTFKTTIKRIFDSAIKKEQIKPIDSDQLTTVFIATLEGAIMMSKLERKNDALNTCISYLKSIITDLIKK